MIQLSILSANARWQSARVVDGHDADLVLLEWNTPPRDPTTGSASLIPNSICEDGHRYDVIATHPCWTAGEQSEAFSRQLSYREALSSKQR